jgi:hypothetical protein
LKIQRQKSKVKIKNRKEISQTQELTLETYQSAEAASAGGIHDWQFVVRMLLPLAL